MVLSLKANNKIINDYFKDYRACVIEAEREDIPLLKSGDNFDQPKGGGKKLFYYVRLKGYQPIFNIDIYRSDDEEKCKKYLEQLFSLLSKVTPDDNDKRFNLDELIKI